VVAVLAHQSDRTLDRAVESGTFAQQTCAQRLHVVTTSQAHTHTRELRRTRVCCKTPRARQITDVCNETFAMMMTMMTMFLLSVESFVKTHSKQPISHFVASGFVVLDFLLPRFSCGHIFSVLPSDMRHNHFIVHERARFVITIVFIVISIVQIFARLKRIAVKATLSRVTRRMHERRRCRCADAPLHVPSPLSFRTLGLVAFASEAWRRRWRRGTWRTRRRCRRRRTRRLRATVRRLFVFGLRKLRWQQWCRQQRLGRIQMRKRGRQHTRPVRREAIRKQLRCVKIARANKRILCTLFQRTRHYACRHNRVGQIAHISCHWLCVVTDAINLQTQRTESYMSPVHAVTLLVESASSPIADRQHRR
jgi:hypothetical protein